MEKDVGEEKKKSNKYEKPSNLSIIYESFFIWIHFSSTPFFALSFCWERNHKLADTVPIILNIWMRHEFFLHMMGKLLEIHCSFSLSYTFIFNFVLSINNWINSNAFLIYIIQTFSVEMLLTLLNFILLFLWNSSIFC